VPAAAQFTFVSRVIAIVLAFCCLIPSVFEQLDCRKFYVSGMAQEVFTFGCHLESRCEPWISVVREERKLKALRLVHKITENVQHRTTNSATVRFQGVFSYPLYTMA
jgi:hypothetical protein